MTALRRVVLRDGRRWEVRSESTAQAIVRACDALRARWIDVQRVEVEKHVPVMVVEWEDRS